MTDRNDDDRRSRPPRGGSDRPRTGGDRPFRARDDSAPRKPREGGDKPFRARDGDERRPPRAGGDKPFRKPREGGDRPFRARPQGDRPFAKGPHNKRPEGARPRPAPGGDDRPRRPREEPPVAAAPQEPVEDRIAKVMARAGVASRRDAEAMIAEGRVTLNGKVLDTPAMNVTSADVITVDGEPLPTKERTRLWLFHKPRGLVTTARDPEGRPTVFEHLPEDLPRVVAVGRLDINTEGLLLLTNDGGLARVIAHPDTGWLRRYKVRAHGEVNQADLDRLRDGVTIDGMEYGPIEARLDRVQGDNAWITLGLREGKNREVKRILENLGLQVNRLIRLSFGPFQLGDIEPGLVEEVRTKVLRDQLGAALAEQAEVDFESPVREPIAPFGTPAKRDDGDRDARAERPERRDRAERPERPSRGDRPDRGERQDRGERPDRGPARFGRDRDERPRRDGERPFRSRDDRPARGPREEEAAPPRPDRNAPKRSVWRAGEDENAPRKSRAPRRGADPHEARTVNAERPRERMAKIDAGEGRKVVVERLVSTPAAEERPARAPRRDDRTARPMGDRPARRPHSDDRRPPRHGEDRPRRRAEETGRDMTDRAPWTGAGAASARPRRDDDRPPRREGGDRPYRPRPEGDERPRRPRPEGERSFRPRPEGEDRPRRPRPEGDRPSRPRPEGDRPFRSRDGDGPARGRAAGDDRPRRGPPRGDAPGRGAGFKGGPRGGAKGGSKGGAKGGAKGPPRGRRP